MMGKEISPKKENEYDEYAQKSDMQTLMEAEEIRSNQSKMKILSKLMSKKEKHLKKIKSMADLNETANNFEPDEE